MPDVSINYHEFHAEAKALSGRLRLPLDQEIPPQALVNLKPEGGYLDIPSPAYRVESVLSYESAYTQVAGHREVKPGHGWSTLVTAVVEGLNVLDVVTADRVVGQISTEYPLDGYVPSVTFLGTRFENLRIAGHKIEIDFDHGICGPRPADSEPYTKSSSFISKVSEQHARIREGQGKHNLVSELLDRYKSHPENFATGEGDEEAVDCSLVNGATGSFPGHNFGHVIHIPDFGTIYLATLRVRHHEFEKERRAPKRTHFELNMMDIHMGCIATGKVGVASMKTNGTSGQSGTTG